MVKGKDVFIAGLGCIHIVPAEIEGRTMNNEKQIAQTIIDAQKMREESYFVPTGDGSGIGDYKLDVETCLKITSGLYGLSANMWYLLSLTCHWMNDAIAWAEDIIAGKDITDSILTNAVREKLVAEAEVANAELDNAEAITEEE